MDDHGPEVVHVVSRELGFVFHQNHTGHQHWPAAEQPTDHRLSVNYQALHASGGPALLVDRLACSLVQLGPQRLSVPVVELGLDIVLLG